LTVGFAAIADGRLHMASPCFVDPGDGPANHLVARTPEGKDPRSDD